MGGGIQHMDAYYVNMLLAEARYLNLHIIILCSRTLLDRANLCCTCTFTMSLALKFWEVIN
jgi:hypothetical protein